MRLRISSVDYAPDELEDQLPLEADLLRRIPGTDRPDYWIASLVTPVRWNDASEERLVNHLVLVARWEGTTIGPGMQDLPVNIAYVIDASLLEDSLLDFGKCSYVAIGVASDAA